LTEGNKPENMQNTNPLRKFHQPEKLPINKTLLSSEGEHYAHNDDMPVPLYKRALLVAYLCALMFPATFKIGFVALTGTRTFLTIAIIPALVAAGRMRPVTACDVLVLLYGIWSVICLFVNQGLFAGVEPAGSHFIEVIGSYFFARVVFDNAQTFLFWSKCLFFCVLLLVPFAIYEALTARPLILDSLRSIMSTYQNVEMGKRLGLDRAQTIFEHPILFGVFCAGAFSPTLLVLFRNRSVTLSLLSSFLVALGTFLSLSTGAYLNIVGQLAFMSWDRVFDKSPYKWRTMSIIAVVVYVTIDLLSNRTPFEAFITYLTFDTNSAFTRVLTWRFGTAEILRNPVFGIGLNAWSRPNWLTSSVDNFWLLRGMRFGLPGITLLLLATFLTAKGIINRLHGRQTLEQRVALTQLCLLAGCSISMVTVDLWSGSHTLFFFLLGSINGLNVDRGEKP
jgi:O-Antigen ligase